VRTLASEILAAVEDGHPAEVLADY